MLKLLLDNVEMKYPAVIKGVVPDKIPFSTIHFVLVNLIKRKKSIRRLIKIIEVLEEEVTRSKDNEALTEAVLKRLYT